MDDLLDTAPCGFLTFKDDGTVVAINSTLLNWLGYAPDEVRGRHLDTILSASARIYYQTLFFPRLKLHGKVEEIYLLLRARTGETVPMLANAARRERQGGFFNDCVFLPMRQRSRYEDELLHAKREAEEASRLKDEFLATVSHELRTPLTSMLGWLHLLRTRQNDPHRAAHAIEVIERNARSQAQLIEDLLDVSRIVSGKMLLDIQTMDPVKVIEAAIESVRPAAEAKGVRLHKRLDTGGQEISGDAARLQQVIWNLLSNAIKFTPKDGRVEVRLDHSPDNLQITVSDTGIGISPEFLPYVFDRFRQADGTVKRQHGGLGLGLAIVRHLVELHGGEVRVHSAGEGQGTTFTILLPLLAVEPRPITNRAATTSSRAVARSIQVTGRLDGVRVLAVDDETDTRESLVAILRQYGAEVVSAATAEEALALLGQWHPQVVVSDIGLPGTDGYALMQQMRARPPEAGGKVPAVALTAYARMEDRLKALQAGYQMHLAKPIEPAELIAVITSLVDRTP